jgi:hypothetical protein
VSDTNPVVAGVAQYLSRYASPEVTIARAVGERYRSVLVVPAFREAAGMLEQYRAALDAAPGRVLVIVVVNAAAPFAVSSWPLHEELLSDLRGPRAIQLSSAPPAWLARHERFDVLSIDRAHPDTCLPERQGVGLARRIGCDLALALHAAGRIEVPFLYCTDADAELPARYFDEPLMNMPAAYSAITFAYWHVPGGDPAIDSATAVYELGLRYYVAGLVHAGSPFAFHALGSAMAVEASAYAAVRGFPKRLAGEDFYLLDKLAKVAPIWRDRARTVKLRSRASLRTAHGTGVAAVRLAAESRTGSMVFYNPRIFDLLGAWLRTLDGFAGDRDIAGARSSLELATAKDAARLDAVLEELGAWASLELAASHTRSERALRHRLHTWFDGFRTLKLVHGLRNGGLESVPFREALSAPWCETANDALGAPVDELRRRMADQYARLEPNTGLHF